MVVVHTIAEISTAQVDNVIVQNIKLRFICIFPNNFIIIKNCRELRIRLGKMVEKKLTVERMVEKS